jgi:hypothetical protein
MQEEDSKHRRSVEDRCRKGTRRWQGCTIRLFRNNGDLMYYRKIFTGGKS